MTKKILGSLSTEVVIRLFNADLCQKQLGIRATGVNKERATAVMELKEWHMNFEKTIHGGMLFSLLDSIMGMAVFPHLNKDERILAIDLKINYLLAATLKMKQLSCEANLVSRTRRLAVAEGEIYDPKGRILTKALGTFAIMK
jgi:acyl-CoA thioesterase